MRYLGVVEGVVDGGQDEVLEDLGNGPLVCCWRPVELLVVNLRPHSLGSLKVIVESFFDRA